MYEEILKFIDPALLVLIPVLISIGTAFKHSQKIPDGMIPLFLGGVGIILAVLWVLATSDLYTGKDLFMALFTAIVQGVLCAAAAVYGHQIVKQGGKNG